MSYNIFVYAMVFDSQKFAKLQKSPPKSADGFELVPQPDGHDAHCDCTRLKKKVSHRINSEEQQNLYVIDLFCPEWMYVSECPGWRRKNLSFL